MTEQRAIKFRIWDGTSNAWLHDTEHAINILGEMVLFGEVLRRPDDTRVSIADLNKLSVMQYTGPKAKNGKEIYEGDIVKDVSHSDLIFPVMWDNEKAGYYMPEEFDSEYTWSISEVDLEIIGTLYENPELLKASK